MASKNSSTVADSQLLEEKVADLHLQDKEKDTTLANALDYLDSTTSAEEEAQEKPGECEGKTSVVGNEGLNAEREPEPSFLDADVAKPEMENSAEGTYTVLTVDHRSSPGPEGEEKKADLPAAIVHENMDVVAHDAQAPLQSLPDVGQVDVAREEVKRSPDEGAYTVTSVDHRSIAGPEGEEKKVDLPTAVVHENADVSQDAHTSPQSKGIIQSVTGKISQSVKSVFSTLTGSKPAKNLETKPDDA